MKLINKEAPPALLVTYAKQLGASYKEMDEKVKSDLQEALLKEQGWVCGYCQQRIKDKSKVQIEHFCEQSICNGLGGTIDKRLEYKNLMAVCIGKVGNGELHCDSKKATFKAGHGLPIHVSPWETAHMSGVTYSSTGLIDSSNAVHSTEINDILNLNIDYLKDARQKIWKTIFALSRNKQGSVIKDKFKKLTESNSVMAGDRYPISFPGLYEYMLKRFC